MLESLHYFFQKATRELIHFNQKSEYEKISTEKDGVLFYTRRILPSQKFDTKSVSDLNLSDACIDLVPVHSVLQWYTNALYLRML